jgi:hypothetical protein
MPVLLCSFGLAAVVPALIMTSKAIVAQAGRIVNQAFVHASSSAASLLVDRVP